MDKQWPSCPFFFLKQKQKQKTKWKIESENIKTKINGKGIPSAPKKKTQKQTHLPPKSKTPSTNSYPPSPINSGHLWLLQPPPSKSSAVNLAIADEATNTVARTHREQPYCSRDLVDKWETGSFLTIFKNTCLECFSCGSLFILMDSNWRQHSCTKIDVVLRCQHKFVFRACCKDW